ncbi:MAG: RHS repeat-associated core domain-containing protein, partial [Candidatus Eremiobacterota bacterium]
DAVDRPTTVTDARGKSTVFTYLDGLLDEVELPANQGSDSETRKTNYVYDTPGRVTEIHSDIATSTQQLRVKFEYTSFSNVKKLIRLMDEVEKFTEYDHDALGRTTHVRDPLHTQQNPRETVIEHAPFCSQFTVTTARGVARETQFDTLCRLTQVTSPSETQAFDYDELGRLVSVTQTPESRYGPTSPNEGIYGAGRYGGGTPHVRKFEWDELDRLIKMTFEDAGTLLYGYDEEGNLLELTDTEGNVTEYAYYKDNRLKTVTLKRSGQADRVFTYRYDEAGRLKTITYPEDSGIVANFGFDDSGNWVHGWNENGQLLYLEYKKDGTTTLQRFEYAYDDSGNRRELADTPLDTSKKLVWSYSYDRLNRLAEVVREMPDASPAVPTVTTYYAYDESDNRIEFGYTEGEVGVDPTVVTEYTYNEADEILERYVDSILTETFTHDLDGNMVGRVLNPGGQNETTTAYRFDDMDRLVRIERTPDGGSTTRQRHRYDSGNIRKSKSEMDGTRTEFRYNGLAVANESRTPLGGSAVKINFFVGDQVLGFERDGDFFYFLSDGLASVRVIVDEDGAVQARYNWDEFGNRIETSETGTSSAQTWVGALGVRDEAGEFGLYYMRQRLYDPGLGRWVCRDPIGFGGGLNWYLYVSNVPTNTVDPSGLKEDEDWPFDYRNP